MWDEFILLVVRTSVNKCCAVARCVSVSEVGSRVLNSCMILNFDKLSLLS